jgi:hypothetical protein
VNAMLSEDDLTLLLRETAGSFDVPGVGPVLVLAELEQGVPHRPWLRRRGVQLLAVAAAVVAGVVLVQGPGWPDSPGTRLVADAPAKLPTGFAGGTAGSTGGTTGGGLSDLPVRSLAPNTRSDAKALPGATVRAPSTRGGVTFSGDAGAAAAPAQQNALTALDAGAARIVKTGSLDLVVGNGRVSATVDEVQAVAKGAAGYVSNEKSVEFGDKPTSTLTMRVPVASYESVVAAVRDVVKTVGGKVAGAQSSGKDVTAAYADTAAQIQSLRAARSRFLTILAGARTVGETLTVQQRVDEVQGQLDRLEGQRRVLADQSALATLTVTVSEKADIVKLAGPPSGLSEAWDDAKGGFSGGVEALLARSGRALLVLMVAGLALVVARLGWRLARRRLV